MNHKRVHILLVEDNPQDAELILRALNKQNLSGNVLVARDGAEALEILFAPGGENNDLLENLKVILLDVKLPKVSGQEVLQKIKADGRTRSIPVVCLTSSSEESDINECYHWGCNSYIVKPVEFDEFTQAITSLASYWVLLNQTSPQSCTL
ncbi:MAG: response regulator [Deltaproteobacteria bacterium]|nr:MAG: response regulator [Deltaproteobacteria bacterium]